MRSLKTILQVTAKALAAIGALMFFFAPTLTFDGLLATFGGLALAGVCVIVAHCLKDTDPPPEERN